MIYRRQEMDSVNQHETFNLIQITRRLNRQLNIICAVSIQDIKTRFIEKQKTPTNK